MTLDQEDPRLSRATNAMAQGQLAQGVFQFLEDYLLGRQRQLDRELFEAAEDRWESIVRQKIEAHRFVTNLMQMMKAGESGARLLAPMMELSMELPQ